MYRWLDLRADLVDHEAQPTGSRMLGESTNGPDSDCNGIPRGDRHFLFIHGFNVNAQQARGWGTTVFKRLWQSGNNDRFTVVDWYGDHGKGGLTGDSWEYYQAVDNAFRTAEHLKKKVGTLGGKKWIIAHSLGNMVVSAAIQDWNMAYEKFYMVNAAVAVQAFDADVTELPMFDPDWKEIKDEYCAHGWHALFDANDFRSTLNWKGRFASIKNAINCYSETDEVIKNVERKPWPLKKLDVLDSCWVYQERKKGTPIMNLADKVLLKRQLSVKLAGE